jgi:mercuric ion transport protein
MVSALLASACCIGPVLFAVLGISGAAAAATHRLEPFRPYFLVLTFGLLAYAFYATYRPAPMDCGPDGTCAVPQANRIGKVLLWLATVAVVLATTFQCYAEYLPL